MESLGVTIPPLWVDDYRVLGEEMWETMKKIVMDILGDRRMTIVI